jgi:hypothetical protein
LFLVSLFGPSPTADRLAGNAEAFHSTAARKYFRLSRQPSPLPAWRRGRVVLRRAAGSNCGFFRIGWDIEVWGRIRYRVVFLRMPQHVAGCNSASGVCERIQAPFNASSSTCKARINRVYNRVYNARHV